MEIDYADKLPAELWNQIFKEFEQNADFPTLAAVYRTSRVFRELVNNIVNKILARKQKDPDVTPLRALYNYKIAHIDPARSYTTIPIQGRPITTFAASCPMLVCFSYTNRHIQITKLTKDLPSFDSKRRSFIKCQGRYIWEGQDRYGSNVVDFNEFDKLNISNSKGLIGGFRVEGKRYFVRREDEFLKFYMLERGKTVLADLFSLQEYYKTFHIVCKKKRPDQLILTKRSEQIEKQSETTRQLCELKNNKLEIIREFKINSCLVHEYISIHELSYAISKHNNQLKIISIEDEKASSWDIDLTQSKLKDINLVINNIPLRFCAEKSILSIMFKGSYLPNEHAFIERYFLSETGKATKLCSIEHQESSSKGLGLFANKAYFSCENIEEGYKLLELDLSVKAAIKTNSTMVLETEKRKDSSFISIPSGLVVANPTNVTPATSTKLAAVTSPKSTTSTSTQANVFPASSPPTDTLTHNPSLTTAAIGQSNVSSRRDTAAAIKDEEEENTEVVNDRSPLVEVRTPDVRKDESSFSTTNDFNTEAALSNSSSTSKKKKKDALATKKVQTPPPTKSTSPTPAPTTPPTDTLTHNPSLIPAAPSLFVLVGLGSLYLSYRGWKSFPKHSWKGLSYAAIPFTRWIGHGARFVHSFQKAFGNKPTCYR